MNTNLDIYALISALRRNAKLIVICTLAGAAVGLLYDVVATPLYTAATQILIEQRQVRSLRDASSLSENHILETAVVESQANPFVQRMLGSPSSES